MVICEMSVSEFYKLSIGHIALVGNIAPDINTFIQRCKADLYINERKVKSINILGEDRFSGGDEEKRKGIRSIRTDDDIMSELNANIGKSIKLVIFLDGE